MRGLPFPSNAQYEREPSFEYGSPLNFTTEIPIDPALQGSVIDQAIMGETSGPVTVQYPAEFSYPQQHTPDFGQYPQMPLHQLQEPGQYSEGPQGDPFAPPPPVFLPVKQQEPTATPKPSRRKRRPKKEDECGFCQGDGVKGENGEPEPLLTCSECGRSGHRSCLKLGEVTDVVWEYEWKCMECKNCEICHEKGDDERILFCDCCDRGWHMDCLDPPIAESPPGKWHCPICPPAEELPYVPMEQSEMTDTPISHENEARASSPEPSEVGIAPAGQKGRSTQKPKKKGKNRLLPLVDASEDDPPPSLPKKKRRLNGDSPAPTSYPSVKIRLRIPQKGKSRERQEEEERRGLFDDILPPEARDTTRTAVELSDKLRFEKCRRAAEAKQVAPPPRHPATFDASEISAFSSRPLRSAVIAQVASSAPISVPPPSASPAPSTPGPHPPPTLPHTLRIHTIRFGQYDIQTWYDAPFPEEYATMSDGRLWICEFCLKYMKSQFGSERHRMKCKARHPPGDEIYRDGNISVFEVDGRKNKIYCQNLCLLSKMFLDHKSLFYDVEPFLFYVMTEVDEVGARFIGYFSKEKRSPKDYNVSCIMTLPVRQRQGWGNLLIDFSYLLSKKEGRVGSPEKPLSALGALGYRNYWTLALMRYLENAQPGIRLEDISAATSMTTEDVYTMLVHHSMISVREMTLSIPKPAPGQSIRFPRGRKNGVTRRHLQRTNTPTTIDDEAKNNKDPFKAPTEYEIYWDPEKVASYLRAWEAKKYPTLKTEKLKWSPFLLARISKTEGAKAARIPGPVPPTEGQPSDQASSVAATTEEANQMFVDTAGAESSRESNVLPVITRPTSPSACISSRATPPPKSAPPMRSGSMDRTIDADEAFAARLALEERMRSRQLRPRSRLDNGVLGSPSHDDKKAGSSGSRSTSPRKRRRVVESPLEDDAVERMMGAEEQQGPHEPNTSTANGMSECARASMTPRGPSSLVRGNSDMVEAFVNGHGHRNHSGRQSPSSPDFENPSCASQLNLTTETLGTEEIDLGSPLTGVTSQQSLPDDDTDSVHAWG